MLFIKYILRFRPI